MENELTNDKEFTYNGLSYNEGNHLYYIKARYYDSSISSFISRDTYLGDTFSPSSFNHYAYCAKDPVNHCDRDGHRSVMISGSDGGRRVNTPKPSGGSSSGTSSSGKSTPSSGGTSSSEDSSGDSDSEPEPERVNPKKNYVSLFSKIKALGTSLLSKSKSVLNKKESLTKKVLAETGSASSKTDDVGKESSAASDSFVSNQYVSQASCLSIDSNVLANAFRNASENLNLLMAEVSVLGMALVGTLVTLSVTKFAGTNSLYTAPAIALTETSAASLTEETSAALIGTLIMKEAAEGTLDGLPQSNGLTDGTDNSKKDSDTDKKNDVQYKRPSHYSDEFMKKLKDAADKDELGNPVDPNTGKPLDLDWTDVGHKKGKEFWKLKKYAKDHNWPKEIWDKYNKDPDHFQLEDRTENRSRRHEDKSNHFDDSDLGDEYTKHY